MAWLYIMVGSFVLVAGTYLSWHIYQILPSIKYRKLTSIMLTFFLFILMLWKFVVFGILANICMLLLIYDFVMLCLRIRPVAIDFIKKYTVNGLVVMLVGVLISGYGIYNANQIITTRYDVTIHKKMDDIKILAVSDLHLSTTVSTFELDELKQKVESEKPDMVFLVGDIYDENTNETDTLYSISTFAQINKIAPVYYVEGNHDRGYEKVGPLEKYEVLEKLVASGITVLQDEVVEKKGIVIVGRKDARIKERQRVETLLQNIEVSKPIIVLDHQPKDLKENSKLHVDLQISGHTHAGQMLPIGQLAELVGVNEMNYGIRTMDDFHAIVTSGMGTWGYPLRTSKHCEMVIINMHGEE